MAKTGLKPTEAEEAVVELTVEEKIKAIVANDNVSAEYKIYLISELLG
jgi:hypothetical protein